MLDRGAYKKLVCRGYTDTLAGVDGFDDIDLSEYTISGKEPTEFHVKEALRQYKCGQRMARKHAGYDLTTIRVRPLRDTSSWLTPATIPSSVVVEKPIADVVQVGFCRVYGDGKTPTLVRVGEEVFGCRLDEQDKQTKRWLSDLRKLAPSVHRVPTGVFEAQSWGPTLR